MNHIVSLAIKKAKQSNCRYKVSALGFNRKGDLLGTAINMNRLPRKGCSIHAEIALIKKYGRKLKTIVICRTNKRGDIRPITPCKTCLAMLNRYDIDIKTIRDINDEL